MKVRFDQVFGIIDAATKQVIKDRTYKLKNEIVAIWPVKSGRSKAGWKIRGNQYGWSVVNNVKSPEGYDYVPNLWFGLPLGSPKLPNGGDPVFQRHMLLLEKDLKRMKFGQ